MRNIHFVLTLCLFTINVVTAQLREDSTKTRGVVTGSVFDSLSGTPIPFATVSLHKTLDSSIVSGNITDSTGKYFLRNIQFGHYYVVVNFVGYTAKFSEQFKVFAVDSNFTLKAIRLKNEAININEVNVVARKKLIEIIPGGYSYNVENNIISANGNAKDILKQVPGITVNNGGGIQLRGSGNVNVMIDGRSTNLSGNELDSYLQQIGASNIKSIIVNTNPTAQYDAQGSAGIIDIRTKVSVRKGTFGSLAVGVSTHDKYNGDININFNKKSINTFFNIAYFHTNYWSYSNYLFQNKIASESNYFYEQYYRTNNTPSNSISANGGLDIKVGKKGVIGGSYRFAGSNGNSQGDIYSDVFSSTKELQSQIITNQKSNFNLDRSTYNVYYRKEYETKGKELLIGANHFNSNRQNYTYFVNKEKSNTEYFFDEDRQKNLNNNGIKILTANIDYKSPIHSNNLQLGAKYTFTNNENLFINEVDTTLGRYTYVPLYINTLNYTEAISAGYLNYSGNVKKYSFQIGLRVEQTSINLSADSKIHSSLKRNYTNIFPNIFIKRGLNKKQEISVSIGRRIDRPKYSLLNNAVNNVNPYYQTTGNPYLQPTFSYNTSLNYTFNISDSQFIMSSLYHKLFENAFGDLTTFDELNQRYVETPINFKGGSMLGVDVISQNEIGKWFESSLNFNFRQSRINAYNLNISQPKPIFTFSTNLTFTFKFWNNSALQLSGSYSSPQISLQGRNNKYQTYDIGFKKNLFKNKLNILLSITDFLNVTRNSSLIDVPFLFSNRYEKTETRILSVRLGYNFGKALNSLRRYNQPENTRADYK